MEQTDIMMDYIDVDKIIEQLDIEEALNKRKFVYGDITLDYNECLDESKFIFNYNDTTLDIDHYKMDESNDNIVNNQIYIDGEYFNINFDKMVYIPNDLKNYIILIIKINYNNSDNLIYYISNKKRFDNILNIPINIIFNYIELVYKDIKTFKIDRFKTIIYNKYCYIKLLQHHCNNLPPNVIDKWLFL
jgi:hypothetical protein